jgi:hypothetical protein
MELYLCIYFVLKSLNIVYPIKPIDIQESKNQFITFINYEKVKSQEDKLIDSVLVALYHQESVNAGGYKAIGYNTNGTIDYGKYQINSTNLYKYGINPDEFLNNPIQQEQFARDFMKLHINILKSYNKDITFKRLKLAWAGIAYALY